MELAWSPQAREFGCVGVASDGNDQEPCFGFHGLVGAEYHTAFGAVEDQSLASWLNSSQGPGPPLVALSKCQREGTRLALSLQVPMITRTTPVS